MRVPRVALLLWSCLGVVACATPPCPESIEIGVSRTQGQVEGRDRHDQSADGGAYREHTVWGSMRMGLGIHHEDCLVFHGGRVDREKVRDR